MNIDEERKAFEIACPLPEGVRIENPDYHNAYKEMQFGIWCKAKAHAAEMAKVEVSISETLMSGWMVYLISKQGTFDGVIASDFGNKFDAKTWAIGNGYRVIEE